MFTNLDPSAEVFLGDIGRLQQRLQDVSRQISSGKRITKPSDAPDQIAPLLQLRANLLRNQQIQANMAVSKAVDDTAEGALGSAGKLLDRALALVSQALSFTQDTSGWTTLASQVQSLQEQMLNLSQSAVDGRFIFTGDDDTKAAYSQGFAAANGVTRLSSAPVTRQFEHPAGGSFLSGLSAQDIFDHRNPDDSLATDNVFAALNSLRIALLNGDITALHTAADSIKSGTDHLNTSVSFYGNTQTRIEDATNYAATYDVRIQIEISQKEEADLVSAALASTQVNTQLQAAFQMRSKMTRNSLFDYLG